MKNFLEKDDTRVLIHSLSYHVSHEDAEMEILSLFMEDLEKRKDKILKKKTWHQKKDILT